MVFSVFATPAKYLILNCRDLKKKLISSSIEGGTDRMFVLFMAATERSKMKTLLNVALLTAIIYTRSANCRLKYKKKHLKQRESLL